jgi:hypothetical protein
MLRTLIAIAAGTAALALPVGALAMYGPAGGESAGTVATSSSPVNLLRDGKYSPAPKTATPPSVQVVRVVRPGGFDFVDAGIGAAVAAVGLALVGGLVIVVHRDHPAPSARTITG